MSDVDQQEIRQYMRTVVHKYIDGEGVDCAVLAQDAAWHFGYDKWMDYDQHPVWDCAVQVAQGYENSLKAARV